MMEYIETEVCVFVRIERETVNERREKTRHGGGGDGTNILNLLEILSNR